MAGKQNPQADANSTTSNDNDIAASGLRPDSSRPGSNPKVKFAVLALLIGSIGLITGMLGVVLLLNSSSPPSTNPPTSSDVLLSSPPQSLASSNVIMVGPDDHRVDLALVGPSMTMRPISVAGIEVPQSDGPVPSNPNLKRVIGAFATSNPVKKLEEYYSQKLPAAGYRWDWEDVCGQDSSTTCPQSRYFTAGLQNCLSPGNGNSSSQGCDTTYQINLWIVGAGATPSEYQAMNIPLSITKQLQPGETLVTYSAEPIGNLAVSPNAGSTRSGGTGAGAGVATTAALVPTPTQTAPPATPTDLTKR